MKGTFKEMIMATNPTVEGDGTALYISNLLVGAARRHDPARPGNYHGQCARIC